MDKETELKKKKRKRSDMRGELERGMRRGSRKAAEMMTYMRARDEASAVVIKRSPIRKMLAAKIHRATVTEGNLDYEGSITLPAPLMKAAGLVPFESVLVWDITSGNRFETYAIMGEDDQNICINGAAAHLAKPGDLIIVSRFVWVEEKECCDHRPNIVLVDAQNKITKIEHQQKQVVSG